MPNREKQGYGLTPELIEVAIKGSFLRDTPPSTDNPVLLITVDNGISSFSGVKAAKECGMRVLITDHHLPRENLPDANAIVNPKQKGDLFPSKNLCGVGVIFYVMMALRARLREKNWFKTQNILEPNMADFLDLVALGTITDVVPLDYNNRILIEQGLRRIRANRCSQGIGALVQISKREQTRLIASDLAFYVGPYLNAAGRMDDMSYGIRCLLSEDYFKEMMKQYNFKDPNKFIDYLATDIKLPKLKEDIYYFLPLRMFNILPTVAIFSSIDLETGKKHQNFFMQSNNFQQKGGVLFLENGARIDLSKKVIIFGRQIIPIKNFAMVAYNNNGKLIKNIQKVSNQGLNIIFMKSYKKFLIMDDRFFNSAYIQLFVFENTGGLFEPVILNPFVKVYKVKK